jgi:type II secretory pathway pseudopilin PulG
MRRRLEVPEQHDPARARGQLGMTMTEILLVIVITAGLLVPLVGWSTYAVQYQQDVDKTNDVAAAVGLLQTYFARDVATADFIDKSAAQGWQTCSDLPSGHILKLVLVSSRPHPDRTESQRARMQRTVTMYMEAPRVGLGGPEVAGDTSLWRVQCQRDDLDGDSPGLPVQEGATRFDEVVEHVTSGVLVRCWPAATSDPAYCSTVTIDLTPVRVPVPTQVRARQLAQSDTVVANADGGSEAPTVQIATTPDPVVLPNPAAAAGDEYKVSFTATADLAATRTITGWTWAVRGPSGTTLASGSGTGTSITFSHNFTLPAHAGKHTIFATVTDNTGATGTSYRVVDPANQPPIVDFLPNVEPIVLDRCTSQTFTAGWGSYPGISWHSRDPEGDLVEKANWSVTTGVSSTQMPDGSIDLDYWRQTQTPNVRIAGLGEQSVTLTMRDELGAAGSKTRRIMVNRAPSVFRSSDSEAALGGAPLAPNGVSGTASNRSVAVWFRPADWKCGGDVNFMQIWKCNATPVGTPQRCPASGSNPVEDPPAGSSERYDYIWRCLEVDGDPATPPRSPQPTEEPNEDPSSCTPWDANRWDRIEHTGGTSFRVIPDSEISGTDDLPQNWYYRARFAGQYPAGQYFIRICTAGSGTTVPPMRCTNSRTFQLT